MAACAFATEAADTDTDSDTFIQGRLSSSLRWAEDFLNHPIRPATASLVLPYKQPVYIYPQPDATDATVTTVDTGTGRKVYINTVENATSSLFFEFNNPLYAEACYKYVVDNYEQRTGDTQQSSRHIFAAENILAHTI